MIYATANEGVKYAVLLSEFHCESQTGRTLSGAFYSTSGQSMGAVDPTNFEYVIPNTILEAVMVAACSDFSRWDALGVARVPAGLTIFEAAENLFRATRPPGPPVTQGYLVGRWSEDDQCKEWLYVFANHTFQLSGGVFGPWSLDGNELRMIADGNSIIWNIETIDQNNIEVSNGSDSPSRLHRC
jgi:hypothetical protein